MPSISRLAAIRLTLAIWLGLMAGLALAGPLTVHDFTRDRMIFDSGAAFGRMAAQVSLSGEATPGARVEARALPAPGSEGAVPTGWQQIAVSDASGSWAGQLTGVQPGPGWYVAEVRLAEDTGITDVANTRFAAGHVIALWGQSEWHRAVLSGFANLRRVERLRDPEALQIAYVDGTGPGYGKPENRRHVLITDRTPVSSHMTALSNAFAALRPGEKFYVVFHTLSGTAKATLANDKAGKRRWEDDLALHRFAFPNGQAPGLGLESWYNADAHKNPSGFAALTLRAVTGTNPDGSAHVTGQNRIDHHLFPELYDSEQTAWALLGPHRFDVRGFERKIPAMRTAVNNLFDTGTTGTMPPGLKVHLLRGLEPLSYLNGRMDGTDLAHPNTGGRANDGMHRMMRLTAAGALQALGLVSWEIPGFDHAHLDPDRRFIEVWSDAGAISTTRTLRDKGAARAPGYPEVWGFRHNGKRVRHADLTEGRVRVYPVDAARFADGDVLEFANDGVGAESSEDVTKAEVWQDHPVVALAGDAGLEGIPLRALTPQSVLGVIPAAPLPPDPNPRPNLLPRAVTMFAPVDAGKKGAGGWKIRGGAWQAQGNGVLTGGPNGKARAEGLTGPAAQRWRGTELTLSFVMTSPNAAKGKLAVLVKATGSGSKELYRGTIPVERGTRVTLPLGRFPTNRSGMRISFQRKGGPTGTLEIRDLSVKQAR